MPVQTRVEGKRGCGYRKEGGFYLVLSNAEFKACGKLPLPLQVCPCCGQGIKHSRGWTWINGKSLFGGVLCETPLKKSKKGVFGFDCPGCILSTPPEKMGLLWIGREFYKTPEDWINEGRKMGISRRIKGVPRSFKLGETWVAVAHIEAIPGGEGEKGTPGIFQVFKPSAIEYVVKKDDSPEKIEEIEKRGITPIKVLREQREMFEEK